MGVVARIVKHAFDKFITLTGEVRRGFNFNTLLYTPAGDDSIPLEDERLLLVKVDGTGKYVTTGVLTPSQGAKAGEKIFFSRNADGKVVAKLSMLNDGNVKLEVHDADGVIKSTHFFKNNGTVEQELEKDHIFKVKGDRTEEADGKLTVKIKGEVSYTSDGAFSIKGQTAEITGDTELILKTIGASMWCPNGVTNCFICGAPHGGAPMGIVGLKGA